jgi:hypothetical protein
MKNSNLKVRTIDIDIRQDEAHMRDPGSILLNRADQQEMNATISPIQGGRKNKEFYDTTE